MTTQRDTKLTFAYYHAKANFDIAYFSRENRKVNDGTVFLITFVELFSQRVVKATRVHTNFDTQIKDCDTENVSKKKYHFRIFFKEYQYANKSNGVYYFCLVVSI